MNEKHRFDGEVVSIFLSEEGNTANINLDLGFRVWKVVNFDVGSRASYLHPGQKVVVDVEMRKEGQTRTYIAERIAPAVGVQQDNSITSALFRRATLTLQERSTYE